MFKEYIKMFEGLLGRLPKITLKKGLEKEFSRILDEIIRDMGMVWSRYKKNNYIFSEEEKKSYYWKLEKHHYNLNEMIERHGLLKRCPKCNAELPVTTKYFYIDRSRKEGLSVLCKQCLRAIRRENYKRKKSY